MSHNRIRAVLRRDLTAWLGWACWRGINNIASILTSLLPSAQLASCRATRIIINRSEKIDELKTKLQDEYYSIRDIKKENQRQTKTVNLFWKPPLLSLTAVSAVFTKIRASVNFLAKLLKWNRPDLQLMVRIREESLNKSQYFFFLSESRSFGFVQ